MSPVNGCQVEEEYKFKKGDSVKERRSFSRLISESSRTNASLKRNKARDAPASEGLLLRLGPEFSLSLDFGRVGSSRGGLNFSGSWLVLAVAAAANDANNEENQHYDDDDNSEENLAGGALERGNFRLGTGAKD